MKASKEKKKEARGFMLIASKISRVLAVFLVGGVFAVNHWQPYQFFEDGFKNTITLYKETRQDRPKLLKRKTYAGNGVTRVDTNQVFAGLTLIEGIFAEGVELRLIDMSGNVIHRWPANFFEIWDNPQHIVPAKNIPTGPFRYNTQGTWLLSDGSVIFNFAFKGTVKLDKCGELQWKVDRMTHHSITPNPDGSFWIPVKGDVRTVPDDLLLSGVSHQGLMETDGNYEDRLLLVSASGKIEREISVLRALFDGRFNSKLFDAKRISKMNPTHVNDLEIVTRELAQKIDGVEQGDLLISIRQMHMLAIVDDRTGQIKWSHSDDWVRQHDPDITSDGRIEVFNNGGGKISQDGTRASSIVSLDPLTAETRLVYSGEENKPFYSSIMGTHQMLPNGNRLIVESTAGRVFEINKKGETVWEYVREFDDNYAALIPSAIRFESSYINVEDWNCPDKSNSK